MTGSQGVLIIRDGDRTIAMKFLTEVLTIRRDIYEADSFTLDGYALKTVIIDGQPADYMPKEQPALEEGRKELERWLESAMWNRLEDSWKHKSKWMRQRCNLAVYSRPGGVQAESRLN